MRSRLLSCIAVAAAALVGACDDAVTAEPDDLAVRHDFAGSRDFFVTPIDLGPDLASPWPAHCTSGAKDDDETDVDCGGSCPRCATGKACAVGADCEKGFCAASACVAGFGAATQFAVGMNPAGVVIADFNGDKKADVATVNLGGNDVSVLLGAGDGTFAKAVSVAVPLAPSAIAAVDLDGDGKMDLLVTVNPKAVPGLAVLLGKGDGTFQAPVSYATGTDPRAVITGLFNADAKPDVLVLDGYSADFAYLAGNGDGTLVAAATKITAGKSTGIAAGDWNGDGSLDVVVGNNDLYVHMGNGSGGFSDFRRVTGGSGGDQAPVVAGDWNGDGKLDVVLGGSSTLAMFTGGGDGTFASASRKSPDAVYALVAGDWDHDGKLDLAVAGGSSVGVLAGKGDGTFPVWAQFDAGNSPRAIAAGDVNGDGKPDLVVALGQANQVAVLLNTLP